MMDLLKSQPSDPHHALVDAKSGGHMLAAFLWLKKTTSPAGGYDYFFVFTEVKQYPQIALPIWLEWLPVPLYRLSPHGHQAYIHP